ncbi:DUF1861 family protein [Halobacillus sp. BBL2006]|uniref:DUF1861 family protein n=1 Tax=Halobacillus sp. BBL2006 TaxID=1543706 RepID=UPI000541E80C|nr:DUF1861 family protein [Halobacillus sp. BBL2006]KHE67398.1 hypothetical protein LD39_17760 [Halobacillus sp. BBL2006]
MTFTVEELLNQYKKQPPIDKGEKLYFTGVGARDVYNITAPFQDSNEEVIAGRVEPRESEYSEVMFFTKEGDQWSPRQGAPTFELQDPFVTIIHDQLVFGGVEVSPHPDKEDALTWKTVFYKGSGIDDLQRFAEGPQGMKDIRLIELPDQRIGVCTRPQGEKGGRGKIGYTEIDSLDQLTAEVIDKAPLLQEHFEAEEWGGANELYLLENDDIGMLGHIARFDEVGDRHYYPMVCVLNREHMRLEGMKIIATRNDFPSGEAKRKDLVDVLFSGGIIQLKDGKAELYVGVSDAEAHKIRIPDPFQIKGGE